MYHCVVHEPLRHPSVQELLDAVGQFTECSAHACRHDDAFVGAVAAPPAVLPFLLWTVLPALVAAATSAWRRRRATPSK